MRTYTSQDIRNVGIIGHGHSGKTTLTASLLFTSGATPKLTRVEEGNTPTDFDEEETHRKFSIASGVAAAEWKKVKVNFIDTPGHNIFLNDTQGCLGVAESALVVVDAVAGVELQTEKVWQFATNYQQPRAILVNRLDRDRADFDRTLESIHARFSRSAIPIQLPMGSDKEFQGVIDLIRMKAHRYTSGGDGKGKEGEIPSEYAELAKGAHEALVEMVAEGNESLLEEFFAEGTLPVEHIVDGLKAAFREMRLFPVLCLSGSNNIGSDLLLQFIAEMCPSPLERAPLSVKMQGKETTQKVSSTGSVSAFVFKTIADPFAGRISLFKVYSGVLKNDAHLMNVRQNSEERLAHLGVPFGKTVIPVPELYAGDIGAIAKLRDTLTGDSLAEKQALVAFTPPPAAEPSIAFAIAAKSRQDEDRMGQAIQKLMEEDRCLRFYRDPQTKDFLLAGCAQQHVEIAVSRLKNRYHVDVALKAPKIPYRETIRGTANVQGRHKKQTGGHGQFGDCWIRMEPLPRGAKFEFVNEVFGGAIPKNYIPAVEKGILETAEKGFLAGYPMVDFRVVLYDGSYHDVDSSELAFKLAARKAFHNAMATAKPALLEPVMKVEVQSPGEYAGDLIADLNGRRARITGMNMDGAVQFVRAHVPMSEMLSYQNDLTSLTQGRASFTMEFDHYDFVPPYEMEKIVSAAGIRHTEDEE